VGKFYPHDGRKGMSPPVSYEGVSRAVASTGKSPEAVRVWLLGGFRVSVGSRTIKEGAWRLRKAAALVKLLALSPGHRLHREQAMDLLWPDSGKKAASNNLRKILHAARKVLNPIEGSHYLASHEESLVLCPGGDLWVDVDAFEEAAATARRARDPGAYRTAMELYSGELLPADRYEEWAEGRRQELLQTWLSSHLELARVYEERGEYEKGIDVLQKALLEEPTNEAMHASLMRLYAFSDQRDEALAQYERLRGALSGQLHADVGATTKQLREEIVAGTLLPAHPTVVPTAELSDIGKHNLPASRTSFVGRERETLDVKRTLAMTRLLTLTGTGGSGKTRLALEVARSLVRSYPDGVWLVELAGLPDGNLVPQAVAGALGIREQPNQSLTDTLVEAYRSKQMLLVLDNCEHLVEAAAQLMDVLLDSCPHLRVMTTSREALAVAGEVVWRVLPLSLPDPERPSTTRVLERFESVRLFVERARQRDPAFALTADNAQSVAEICRQLDGIPLALELAAARVGTLGIAQISERLENSLGLLTASNRQAARRQWTLRGALDRSYELLLCDEKKLFRRLSVFAGGWTLKAAAFVGSRDGVEELEVLELLSRLVDKSLVMVTEISVSNGVRYRFLEPVRQFAREKLDENRNAEVIRGRHAAFFLALAEEAEPQLRGPEQAAWFDRLDIELDNLRAGLAWLLEHEKFELGLKMSEALLFFWMWRVLLREGRRWLEDGLSKGGTVTAAVRADALSGLGDLAIMLGEYAKAMTLLEESLALYREASDGNGIAGCLCDLGWLVSLQGNHQRSTELLEESIARSRELEDNLTLAFALSRLAGLAMSDTDYARYGAARGKSRTVSRGG
jgi:predicted ATPase/DNA-binding SARP family transcriptional activator